MTISVVIPTHNNIRCLSECLSRIKKYGPSDIDCIVIAQACSDGTAEHARNLGFRCFEYSENKGYAWAVNRGLEKVVGHYVLILNDDAYITPNFFDYMIKDWIKLENEIQMEIGMAGPASNRVAGEQCVPGIGNIDFFQINEFSQRFRRDNERNWALKHYLSGFAMMVRRKCIEEIGLMDEEFFNGHEDNDYCLRFLNAGYLLMLNGSVFIYHEMSKTLDRDYPQLRKGVYNWDKFFLKWKPKENPKLATCYRARITNDYYAKIFKKSVDKVSEFSDLILIYNDHSEIHPRDILEENLSRFEPKIFFREKKSREMSELADRNLLMGWAKEEGADWVFTPDTDQIPEDKFNRAYVEKLMKNPDPEVDSYSFHHFNFWNSEDYFRADGIFGKMYGPEMGRLGQYPILPRINAKDKDLHCFHVPALNVKPTSIALKHYGYSRPDLRVEKYNYYETHDKVKDKTLIGREDYSHILDESNLSLKKWQENNTIGLFTIMKEDKVSILNFFKQFYSFFDEIVVGDMGSPMETLEAMKLLKIRVEPIYERDNFGKARNQTKSFLNTSWIASIDFDEEIFPIPFKRMIYDSCDGYQFIVANFMKDGNATMSESIRLFRNIPGFNYSGYIHETFDEAIKSNKLKIKFSKAIINHYGYLKDDSELKEKFQRYLLMSEKQIQDFPNDPRPYFNAALHYINDGNKSKGRKYLMKAVELNPKFTAALWELFLEILSDSIEVGKKIMTSCPKEHPYHQMVQDLIKRLTLYVQKKSIIPGHVRELEKIHEVTRLDLSERCR